MRRAWGLAVAIGLVLGAFVPASALARIVHIEIAERGPAFDGATFGSVGGYERLKGVVHGEIDPADPRNAIIQDLSLAPRNARGMVEYATEIELLKPADMARGNRVLLVEVPNRGNKLAVQVFDTGPPVSTAERNALALPGDGLLFREGYTLVWFGWQQDLVEGSGRLRMRPIVVRNGDGTPVTGVVRAELITRTPARTLPLSAGWFTLGTHLGYAPASLDNRTPAGDGFLPTLTMRAREQDSRVSIPNSEWSFGPCADGAAARQDERSICYPAGFQPWRLYELIYRAKDPLVAGLGFAAARDIGSFLRNEPSDDAGTPNPVYRQDQVAIIEGSSQSGRMIRGFLHLGFNQDESGRRVYDGAYPHIGGAVVALNIRFAQPGRGWGDQIDHLYPAYDFPFSYRTQEDPLAGRRQGLLDRCRATDTCPRVFHVATALELWEGRQSLGLTDPLGREDINDPPNVRTYIMASTQHGAATLPLPAKPPFGNCQQQGNPNPQVFTMRALLSALVAWVRDDVAPPNSAVPSIATGTLVRPDQVNFPAIPATQYGKVERPAVPARLRGYNRLHELDFGPLYRAGDTSGVITIEPPRVLPPAYETLVPQVDADGNDVAGIRSVFAQVPIGTYTGWNLGRKDRFENEFCNLQGSFIPFAATRAEREAAGDPRPSLEERFPNKDAYVAAIRRAAEGLVAARHLRPDDAADIILAAERSGIRSAP